MLERGSSLPLRPPYYGSSLKIRALEFLGFRFTSGFFKQTLFRGLTFLTRLHVRVDYSIDYSFGLGAKYFVIPTGGAPMKKPVARKSKEVENGEMDCRAKRVEAFETGSYRDSQSPG